MYNLSSWFYKRSTTFVALGSFIIFMAFAILLLPGQAAAAEAYSDGTGSPDTSLIYSASDLYQMAEAYGPAGREAYIRARFSFDLAFPLVYGFFLTACVSWLLGRSISAQSPWQLLNLVPLAGVTFDFLENIVAVIVIGRYPIETPFLATIAPVSTFIKWIFVGGSFALVLIGIALAFISRRKE